MGAAHTTGAHCTQVIEKSISNFSLFVRRHELICTLIHASLNGINHILQGGA